MTYTNNSTLDTGYFYAPYVPLTSTPVVWSTDQTSMLHSYNRSQWSIGANTYAHIEINWEVAKPAKKEDPSIWEGIW